MKLRKVEIKNFRGIKSLTWAPTGSRICLIGPGDSTKTAVLEAISIALSPRWVMFFDSDFHNSDTQHPINVQLTVAEFPDQLKRDDKFGLHLRGWSREGSIHDEPTDDDEVVLTVRLQVDHSLDPSWAVVTDRQPEGRDISARDREAFGACFIEEYDAGQLSWARGSPLTRLSKESDDIVGALAEASRRVRAAVQSTDLGTLSASSNHVQDLVAGLGVRPNEGYRAGLDATEVRVGGGAISLHDGPVPVRLAGTGTRRLITLGMQCSLLKTGGVLLIDEVEHGLEPHRLRQLLRVMSDIQDSTKSPNPAGQTIFTTHSPGVLHALRAEELHVVRVSGGTTTITGVSAELQDVARSNSEAFLSRGVIVCEGRTEVGLCRAYDNWWSSNGKNSFAYCGVVATDGMGSNLVRRALMLASLGYRVAILADSDRKLSLEVAEIEKHGIQVIRWSEAVSTEQRLSLDLPWSGVVAAVELAMSEFGMVSVRDCVTKELKATSPLPEAPLDWLTVASEHDLRRAFGRAAKCKTWFKDFDRGYRLGEIVTQHTQDMAGTDAQEKMTALWEWVNATR